MEAKVLKVNDGEGQVTLTYKRLAAEKGNKRLEEAFENQEVLKAPVTQVLDGGFVSMLRKQEYSFLQALYLTHMRKISQICRSGDRVRYHRVQPKKTPYHR